MLGPFVLASSSRLDPRSTCSRCFPCGDAARDLRSGSGLTANRINLPNASELYPAFDFASRSPRPALSYRPSLTLLFYILQCEKVIALEPRTPHQPEKLKKLSKNESVVLLLFLESTKSMRFYLVCFQPSARRPQACDRIWCRSALQDCAKGLLGKALRESGLL